MPKIFILRGYTISFYSDDHLPVHVHAIGNDGYLIREYPGNTRECVGVKQGDKKALEEWIDSHWDIIIFQWNEYFKEKPENLMNQEA